MAVHRQHPRRAAGQTGLTGFFDNITRLGTQWVSFTLVIDILEHPLFHRPSAIKDSETPAAPA